MKAPLLEVIPALTSGGDEEFVLGAAFLAGTVPDSVIASGLDPDDFYRPSYGVVFAAVLRLFEAREPIDAHTVAVELASRGELEAVGGAAAIEACTAAVPVTGNAGAYAHRIVAESRRRRRHAAAQAFLEDQTDRNRDELHAELVSEVPSAHRAVSLRDYLSRDRLRLTPLVTAEEGRSYILALATMLLFAGPSGLGKSLAVLDLAGLLASDRGGDWLGTSVSGGHRCLLVLLEGSDEDTADRLAQLVPADARERIVISDRWSGQGTTPTPREVAAMVKAHQVDVVFIDTVPAFLEDRYDLSRGVPEAAHQDIESIRRLSGQDLAFVLVAHTRKLDRASGSAINELEEIGGTLAKKADAAIVLRRDGKDGPRRRITFAKTRRGPEPATKIATLPEAGSDEPPRLTVITEATTRIREGTEAEKIAAWIGEQKGPQVVAAITTAVDIAASTLGRRRGELEALGIRRGKVPGAGNSHAYGTVEQWRDAYGFAPELAAEEEVA